MLPIAVTQEIEEAEMSASESQAKGNAKTATVREIVTLIWSQASRFVRTRLILAVVMVVGSSIAVGLAPLSLKLIVDRLAPGDSGISIHPGWFIALYVMCVWVSRMLAAVRGFFHAQADRRMNRAVSDQVFSHVIDLPYRFHQERQTGAINETLSNGLVGYQIVFQHTIYTLLPVFVELGTAAVILINLDQFAFLGLFAAALACYGLAFTSTVIRVSSAARNATTAQVEARAIMTDGLLNYEMVKYFTAEPMLRERFETAQLKTEVSWMSLFRSRMLGEMAVGSIFAAFMAATAIYGAHRVQLGAMTVGDFVLVTAYVTQLVRPIEMLGMGAQQLAQARVFLERMFDLLKQPREPRGSDHFPPMEGRGSLVFERVTVSYREDRQVLKDVSFNIQAGQTVAVVGESGAGKSTLLRLLVRLIEPQHGEILLDGVSLKQLPLLVLRQAIAVVPQETLLLDDTIGRNIAMGRWGSSQAQIEQAAKLACLHDFITRLPDGYATRIGERGVKLSGGEKQRISIARAVLRQPRIFVFDEATSSLDSHTEQEIVRNFRAVSQTTTTLVIAHRLSTIAYADKIVVLKDGVVAEQGTHEELIGHDGQYAALWFAQHSSARAV
ncbi:MAG TPA: ABC transporter ATP-binding protein [Steroidobacteraceae bacterium]|nr:ABC transporter ATP-binding protein [Steroidobacteraceae bacterium]